MQTQWCISHNLVVPSFDLVIISGGLLLAAQQLFTNKECSAIFFIYTKIYYFEFGKRCESWVDKVASKHFLVKEVF
jgi:hypothetical protein